MNRKLTEVSNTREQILSLKGIFIFKVTESILNNAKFDSAVQIIYALWATENFKWVLLCINVGSNKVCMF